MRCALKLAVIARLRLGTVRFSQVAFVTSPFLMIFLVAFGTGCATTSPTPEGPVSPVVAQLQSDLLAVDRAFSDLAAQSGTIAAFSAYLAPDAVKLSPDVDPLLGAPAILKRMSDVAPNINLVWKPLRSQVSAAGDLGYTWGFYQIFSREESASSSSRPALLETGTYVSIWKRQSDGSWKVILDTGTADSAPKSRP